MINKIVIDYELSKFLEQLDFEEKGAIRELTFAKKRNMESEIGRIEKKAEIARLKFAFAKECLGEFLKESFPQMERWKLTYENGGVEII